MTPRKRICFIIDAWFPLIGGGQIYVLEIANIFADQMGFSVTIVTRKIEGGKTSFDSKLSPEVNLVKLGPKARFENIISRVFFLIQSFIYLLFKNYDYYLPQSVLPGIAGKILSLLKRKPVVMVVHGSILNLENKKINLFYLVEDWILTKIQYDRMVSVSKKFTQLENKNKNIVVIPNGVHVEEFDRIPSKTNNCSSILFVGRFDKVKLLDVLLLGFVQVLKSIPDAKLQLVGYGYEKPRLIELTKKLGIESRVYFLGKKEAEELVSIYKQSKVFVLPSISEGHPLTILEAWAARIPVIATDVGDNSHYIKNGYNGYLIAPKEPGELAKKIILVLKDKRQAELMGKNGYLGVKKMTWERSANALSKLLLGLN